MPEQYCHLANKCEDIVNLQGAEVYCVATRTAWSLYLPGYSLFLTLRLSLKMGSY